MVIVRSSDQKLSLPSKKQLKMSNNVNNKPILSSAFSSKNSGQSRSNNSQQKVKLMKEGSNVVNNENGVFKVVTKSLKDFKDECVDCVDSIVFAESTAERIDAVIDIAIRHKTTLSVIGTGILLNNVLLKKR